MVRHGHMTGNCTYSTRRKPTGVVTRPGSRLATGGRFLLPRRYSTQSPTLPGITSTSPSITNPLPAPAHCQHQPVASTNPLPAPTHCEHQPYASPGIPARVRNMSSSQASGCGIFRIFNSHSSMPYSPRPGERLYAPHLINRGWIGAVLIF